MGQHDYLNGFFCEAFKHGIFPITCGRAGMLILAQAKLLDACITDYRHPEAMTWVDGLIVNS
ncbi:MAG: hypothetical protein PUQ00_23085 [Nostoc sp. S13]|nr:hypothetical protein [Nostoc sp. S13]